MAIVKVSTVKGHSKVTVKVVVTVVTERKDGRLKVTSTM